MTLEFQFGNGKLASRNKNILLKLIYLCLYLPWSELDSWLSSNLDVEAGGSVSSQVF